MDIIRQFEPGTLVAMEVCATLHFWGRTLSSMGFCVRLIPAQNCSMPGSHTGFLALNSTLTRPADVDKEIYAAAALLTHDVLCTLFIHACHCVMDITPFFGRCSDNLSHGLEIRRRVS